MQLGNGPVTILAMRHTRARRTGWIQDIKKDPLISVVQFKLVSLVFCAHSGLNVKICNPNKLAMLSFCNRVSVQLIEWWARFKDIEEEKKHFQNYTVNPK